ncbi:MAG: hypothetical protein LC799_16205 [Actinobacteria bacterium]|nr:hypothetical protein [Actinomycetota bacterium]
MIAWRALRRVHGGGVARVGSWWLDRGRQVPDYVPAVLDEFVTAGLVALADPDPVAEVSLRAGLTEAGQTRYGELLARYGGQGRASCAGRTGHGRPGQRTRAAAAGHYRDDPDPGWPPVE